MEEVELADDGGKMPKMMACAAYDGDVPVIKALRSILGMEDFDFVEEQKRMEDEGRPRERFKMEAQAGILQQGRDVGVSLQQTGQGDVIGYRKCYGICLGRKM